MDDTTHIVRPITSVNIWTDPLVVRIYIMHAVDTIALDLALALDLDP
jgi:hypothetical protein